MYVCLYVRIYVYIPCVCPFVCLRVSWLGINEYEYNPHDDDASSSFASLMRIWKRKKKTNIRYRDRHRQSAFSCAFNAFTFVRSTITRRYTYRKRGEGKNQCRLIRSRSLELPGFLHRAFGTSCLVLVVVIRVIVCNDNPEDNRDDRDSATNGLLNFTGPHTRPLSHFARYRFTWKRFRSGLPGTSCKGGSCRSGKTIGW